MNNSNFKITYHQEGDYLIPDLVIKKETNIWILKIKLFKES